MKPLTSLALRAMTLAAALAPVPLAAKAQEIPTIRIGHGSAAEEQLWLMKALPSVTPNQGKLYKLDFQLFRGTDTRFKAFEAGELEVATNSGHGLIFSASQGLEFRAVAAISRETSKGFVTHYMVQESSPIKTMQDLKGKIVGNNAARSSIELWARIALAKSGIDPERDVRWAIVPFPSQAEALRSGKLDIGAFPQPFAANEIRRGGLRTLFTSKDANPYDEELMLLVVPERFAKTKPDLLRAFLADYVAAAKYYVANPAEAKRALIDAKIVQLAPDIYLGMQDYERSSDGKLDMKALNQMQDDLLKHRFTKQRVDLSKYVDLSFLPQ